VTAPQNGSLDGAGPKGRAAKSDTKDMLRTLLGRR
jgi:hypothetical protein